MVGRDSFMTEAMPIEQPSSRHGLQIDPGSGGPSPLAHRALDGSAPGAVGPGLGWPRGLPRARRAGGRALRLALWAGAGGLLPQPGHARLQHRVLVRALQDAADRRSHVGRDRPVVGPAGAVGVHGLGENQLCAVT
jgi:hypothetical protein